ncbi:MAG TPA: hypothetical protein VM012_10905 [Flavitalea sp.]|nr:hypothetical protein [Flavitalea sp.]
MKKILFTLAISLTIAGNSAFAGGEEVVTFRIRESLKKEFSTAQDVRWQQIKNENIFLAQFIYNNERLCAFFDENGQLLVVSRAISAASLPLLVTKKISSKYKDYTLQEVLEYVNGGDTSYLLQLVKGNVRVIVQAFPEGNIQIFKTERIKIK